MKRMIGLTAVLAMAGFGCGDDDDSTIVPPDFGPDDAGSDAGPIDMGPPRPDAGPRMLVGTPCTSDDRCAAIGGTCLMGGSLPYVGLQGGMLVSTDTIDGIPTTPEVPYFLGGYCTADCDTDDVCGPNATCVNGDPDTAELDGFCASTCTVNAEDNDVCRDGYQCLRLSSSSNEGICYSAFFALAEAPGGCDPNAADPDQLCKVEREDTNGVEGIQSPSDCAQTDEGDYPCATETMVGAASLSNYDPQVFDDTNPSTCNTDAWQCVHPGDDTAMVGDMCMEDWDCPTTHGLCLTFDVSDTETTYCTSLDCDLAGLECESGNVCNARALGAPACLESCTVGEAASADGADPTTWTVNEDSCDAGFGCFWDGVGGPGVAGNGACVPGEFNEVTEPNIGAACTDDSDCWSPFGRGTCIEFLNGVQMCTVRDCQAPLAIFEGVDPAPSPCPTAGSDGICVGIDPEDETAGVCFDGCTVGDDCAEGLDCAPILSGGGKVCFEGCMVDEDCHTGETCSGATAEELGECTAS